MLKLKASLIPASVLYATLFALVVGLGCILLIAIPTRLDLPEGDRIPFEDLQLVGVDPGLSGAPAAIIEDRFSGKQDLFSENDIVFGKAKLLKITKKELILDYRGKRLVLVPGSG